MPTAPDNFAALLSRSTLTDLAAEEAVALVGATIDAAWMGKRPEVLEHVQQLASALPRESLPPQLLTLEMGV